MSAIPAQSIVSSGWQDRGRPPGEPAVYVLEARRPGSLEAWRRGSLEP